jgi:pimeloyl-ACP methyl ester carboxylesterase
MHLLSIVLLGALGVIGAAIAALVAFSALNTRRAQRLVPADGRFLDVAGARLHFTDQGSGQTILFIHGLGGQLRNFAQPLVAHLARGHRVIAVDRPGSGHATLTGCYPDIRAQAAMIAELLVRLDAGRVVLAGHSLGGAVSLALAIDRPEQVSSLALLAPLTHTLDEAPGAFRILQLRSALLRRLIGWTLVAPFARFGSNTGRMPAFAPDPVPDDFESRGGGALLYRPQGFDAASRDMQGVPDVLPALTARYREIRQPIAILFGTEDHILDPRLHGELFLERVPGATLTLVPGGHMFPFTRPEVAARWIEAAVVNASARKDRPAND